MTPLPPEDDVLAAEYVLGVLDSVERAAAARRIRADAGFAEAVRQWEERLSPLNAGYPEVAPPDLMPALEARLFPQAEPPPRRRNWFAPIAGALTAAVLALGILTLVPPPAPPPLTASLAAEGQALAFAARIADDTLTLTRTAGEAPAGQDLELWVIGGDGVPASLGLIREAETSRPAGGLAAGQVLAISLEPTGGSTTGQPTGPVLVTGTLVEG